MLARAVKAFNGEVSAGTGITPLEYLKRHVEDGKQPKDESAGTDKERAENAEAAKERQEELRPGMYVRLVSLAREKAELLGSKKMMPRFSEEVFVVERVITHTRRATGNVSYTYALKRTNGQAKEGRYHREQLQIVPELVDEWHGRAKKGAWKRLEADGTVPRAIAPSAPGGKWTPVRDGTSWVEQRVADIAEAERDGLSAEQLIGRLTQYLRSGQSRKDALERLHASIKHTPPDPKRLAVLTIAS
jgi:hypothetical protein